MLYQTQGICAKLIDVEVQNGRVTNVEFYGGCKGNSQAVAGLVTGMKAKDAIRCLRGIPCGKRTTSCPDQLSYAIEQALAESCRQEKRIWAWLPWKRNT